MKLATLLRQAAKCIEYKSFHGVYCGMCYALYESSHVYPNIYTSVFKGKNLWPTLAQHGFEKSICYEYWWPLTEKYVQTRINALNLLADYAEYLDL